jgi:hypothetical protein
MVNAERNTNIPVFVFLAAKAHTEVYDDVQLSAVVVQHVLQTHVSVDGFN